MPDLFKLNLERSYGNTYLRLQEVDKFENVDILFLGSSHTYRSFDNRIFDRNGFSSFNLGSMGQTPLQTKVLLNRHLNRLNPEVIIYEVYPAPFSALGVGSAIDIIANDKIDRHTLNMALKINHIKVYNSLFNAYIQDVLSLNKNPKVRIQDKEDLYVSGGYTEKPIKHYQPRDLPSKRIDLKSKQIEAFNDCLDLISSKDIPVILVYAPLPSSNYSRYENNDEYDSIMRSYSKYYNFNKILTLDDSVHFYDMDHLNQKGVNLFNRKLIELMDK